MKKKIIALALVVLLITALPLSAYAVADHQWYTYYDLKEVTCPNCHNHFTVTVQHTCYMVHGQIVSGFSTHTALCENCGLTFTWDEALIKPETVPGALVTNKVTR